MEQAIRIGGDHELGHLFVDFELGPALSGSGKHQCARALHDRQQVCRGIEAQLRKRAAGEQRVRDAPEALGFISDEPCGLGQVRLQRLVSAEGANRLAHVGGQRSDRCKRGVELVRDALGDTTEAGQPLGAKETSFGHQDRRAVDVQVHDSRTFCAA